MENRKRIENARGCEGKPFFCCSKFFKVLLTIALLFCTWSAGATDYVFVYNGNYLGVNAAGTGLENLPTFDPARCVWTCVYNGNESTLDNTSRALRITYNGNTRYLNGSTTNGSAPTLSETAQNVWRADGTRVIYRNGNNYHLYYRSNSWRTSRTGRAYDNNGYQSYNGSVDYRATLIKSEPQSALNETTYQDAIAVVPVGATLDIGGQVTYSIPASITAIVRTRQAYNTIVVSGTTYYRTTGVYSTGQPSISTDYPDVPLSYATWTPSDGGYTYFGISNSSNTATLTRTDQNLLSENRTYTLTVDAHYGNNGTYPDVQRSASANVTVLLTRVNLTQLNNGESINIRIDESESLEGHYTWQPNHASAGLPYLSFVYTSDDPSIATVDAEGNVTGVSPGTTTVRVQSMKIDGTENEGVSCGVQVNVSDNFDFSQPYYIYNEDKGVFLSRGGTWGTKSLYDNIGIPYRLTSRQATTLVAYDLNGTQGLGSNLYTDNGAPCTWTLVGNAEEGYTFYNAAAGGYLQAGNAHTNTVTTADASNASRWKIVSRDAYSAIRTQKVMANETNVARAAGIDDIGVVNTNMYSAVDKTSEVQSASLCGGTAGWTANLVRGGVTSNGYGCEIFQGTGTLSQTVTDLPEGIYKISMYGFYRDGSTADDWNYNQEGYPVSVMYLAANGEEARFYARGEHATEQGNPNSMAQYREHVNQGKYKLELYTYVGSDGELNLSINVPNFKGEGWAIFSDLTLTYYEDQMETYDLVRYASEMTDMAGKYRLAADFDPGDTPIGTSAEPFTGTVDGQYHVIDGLTHPLFGEVQNATIKNIIVDNVQLTQAVTYSNVQCLGAIVAFARGTTKVYNCGVQASGSDYDAEGNLVTNSSVISGGNNTGSIVGYIAMTNCNVRVVNNYSYANVSGGSYVGGIVGYNRGTALTKDNCTTNTAHAAIAMNMFYGNLSGTSNVSPVYAGNHTSNIQNVNEYNYWRNRADVTYNNYNNQLAVDKDAFLNRFPFYRHILNTHRELAAIYLFGSASAANVAEIGHWYNVKTKEGEANTHPYPIIEPWRINTKRTTVDIERNLPVTSNDYAGRLLSEPAARVGSNGHLTVTVKINGSTYTSTLPITDMDTLNYDFVWGKVVLPFANEYIGWTRDYSKICTGWRVTSVTGGTPGTLTNYNFADRNCTNKDLYDNNGGYVFAQGGNYIVPYGVTAITIEANFAKAFYLTDGSYDIGYNANYGGAAAIGGDAKFKNGYHGQTVYTSLATLMQNVTTGIYNPHQQAIVLVGNFHYNQTALGGDIFSTYTTAGITIMSVDEDNNQEPDYGWYSYHGTTARTPIPPMRFDFVPNIGIGMAARTTNSTPCPTIGIWHSRGWFELTETCVSFMSECEINDGSFYTNNVPAYNRRWIANSGYFIQIVRARSQNCAKLEYLQIGGTAYVEQLYPGPHMANSNTIALCPINVTGGEIKECFMTGKGQGTPEATGNNIYFWCAGGRIHKYLSSYVVKPSSDNCKVTAVVDHARIYRFFGGGTNQTARITGDIDVTMNNSFVDFYCGGPEFGNMTEGRTVTTNATNTLFGEYYGAGYGGTSTTKRQHTDTQFTFDKDSPFPVADFDEHYGGNRLSNNTGYGGTCINYEFEYIMYSGGTGTGVARFYTGWSDFSLAQTGSVTSNLTNCTVGYYKGDMLVGGNFCGGGCQGRVAGTVESTLKDCTILRSAFGGGYKPASNKVKVYSGTAPTLSIYKRELGIFSDFGTPEFLEFDWEYRATPGVDATARKLYTTTQISKSGEVSGNIRLVVDGGFIGHLKDDVKIGGYVFGGGNESTSLSNTFVQVKGPAYVLRDVLGGGNQARVAGNTHVVIGE